MVSENPCNSGVPHCVRCGRAPDHEIHRNTEGHPFALTAGEAVAVRLDEARTRPCRCGHRLSSHHEDPPRICRHSHTDGSCNCNGYLPDRLPYAAPTVRELTPAEAERMLEQRAPGLIAGARAGRAAVEAMQAQCAFCARCSREQGEDGANLIVDPTEPRGSRMHCSFGTGCWIESRTGGGPFEGPRLHQVLADYLSDEHERWTEEDRGAVRLAIADALRARLAGLHAQELRAALDDFFRAPGGVR